MESEIISSTDLAIRHGEAISEYANRLHLQTSRIIPIGNQESMEVVLIPAGEFWMGTDDIPISYMGEGFIGLGSVTILYLLFSKILLVKGRRRLRQFSLSGLIMFAISIGFFSFGYDRIRRQTLEQESLQSDERPKHLVRISHPFYMGKSEVTERQFEYILPNVMSSGLKQHQEKLNLSKNFPARCISWNNAQEFCSILSQHLNEKVRLPTEAEFEYCIRCGTKTLWYTGDTPDDLSTYAWFGGGVYESVREVCLKQPNAWGLYDIVGNLEEFCQDNYDKAYYKNSPVVDPINITENWKVLRGGNALSGVDDCRSARRAHITPTFYSGTLGFRIVLGIDFKKKD